MTAGGPVLTHTLSVSGVMEVRNKVSLQSPVQDDRKLATLVVHGPGGKLTLDTRNLPMVRNGNDVAGVDHSELFAEEITVNGLFDAGRLSFAEPVTRLTVGNGGNFTFDPASELGVDYLTCHGVLTSLAPLNVTGNSVIRTRALLVGENGTLTLDSRALKNGAYSGVSYLVLETVTVNGAMSAGRAGQPQGAPEARLEPPGGGTQGKAHLPPQRHLLPRLHRSRRCHGISDPHHNPPTPVLRDQQQPFRCGHRWACEARHPGGGRFGQRCQMWQAGSQTPEQTIDAGYQKPTPGSQTVSPLSVFTVTTVVVDGTLQGDSLKVVAADVSVGGSITAAGGGFLSNEGPGE